MLSRRTSALLSLLPIAVVVALVLTQHGTPAAKPLPPLPSRGEIARAQAFFGRVEAVCYRSWGELRKMPKARRPEEIRPMGQRLVRLHERMIGDVARQRDLRLLLRIAMGDQLAIGRDDQHAAVPASVTLCRIGAGRGLGLAGPDLHCSDGEPVLTCCLGFLIPSRRSGRR